MPMYHFAGVLLIDKRELSSNSWQKKGDPKVPLINLSQIIGFPFWPSLH